MRIRGHIEIMGTALEPIHHGAGKSGNTTLLRTEEVPTPDGQLARVPFISGNSFRHLIRESGARYALAAMGVEDGSLTKAEVDLLFSGGALTKTGAAVDLARARRLERLFPVLSLCGYSAGSQVVHGKIRVNKIHVGCAENAFRMPAELAALPAANLRASALRGTEFGTRHESTRNPHVARLLTDGETQRLTERATTALTERHADKGDSAQMIYDYQTIRAGAVIWGGIYVDDVTELELGALRSALEYACEGVHSDGSLLYRLGAKASIGLGLVALRFRGALREPVRAPTMKPDALAVLGESGKADLDGYVRHLRDNRDEILSAIREAVS